MVLNSIIYAAAKKRSEQQGESENVIHEFLRETCALPIEAQLNGISCLRRCLFALPRRTFRVEQKADKEKEEEQQQQEEQQ